MNLDASGLFGQGGFAKRHASAHVPAEVLLAEFVTDIELLAHVTARCNIAICSHVAWPAEFDATEIVKDRAGSKLKMEFGEKETTPKHRARSPGLIVSR